MSRALVLIADPQEIFRAGLKSVLTDADFGVLEAGSLNEVVEAVADAAPDIALVDVDLPPVGALAAVSHLVERGTTHAVVWSTDPTESDVLAAVRAGANGYLRKQISQQGIVRCLRGVLRGEAPFDNDLVTPLVKALQGAGERERSLLRAAVLSPREREVLGLVAMGARNKQVASALTISQNTVKRHMQNILRKLELPTRQAAMEFYRGAFAADGIGAFGNGAPNRSTQPTQ